MLISSSGSTRTHDVSVLDVLGVVSKEGLFTWYALHSAGNTLVQSIPCCQRRHILMHICLNLRMLLQLSGFIKHEPSTFKSLCVRILTSALYVVEEMVIDGQGDN